MYHPIPLVNRGFQPVKGLIIFFPVSGDSKLKKIFRQKKLVPSPQLGEGGGRHFVVGTTQKYQFFFFDAAPYCFWYFNWKSLTILGSEVIEDEEHYFFNLSTKK